MKKLFAIALAACLLFLAAPTAVSAADTTRDSGLDYTESTQELKNPHMGFVNNGYAADGSIMLTETGSTPIHVTSGFAWYYVNLNRFSAGNSPAAASKVGGVDKPITAAALSALEQGLTTLRQNGGSALIRFVYDWDGVAGCEPANFEMILTHIRQLCEVVSRFDDIVLGFECGIVGVFGEMHSSEYTGSEYVNRIIDAYLDNTPESMILMLRTPGYIANYLGVTRAQLKDVVTQKGTKAYRLSMFNDGYMNSDNDLGTWSDRAEEIQFLYKQTEHATYGGEYGSAWSWIVESGATVQLPQNALPEMYQTHINFLHSGVPKIGDGGNTYFGYDQYTYSAAYEKPWFPNNSAFYGKSCHDFIRAHLGYRLVLRQSLLSAKPYAGSNLELSGKIENTGFANILHNPTAQVHLVQSGSVVESYDVSLNAADLKSCSTYNYSFSLPLPASLALGDYDVYLQLSASKGDAAAKAKSSIQFANNGGIFNATLGANKLGSITVETAPLPPPEIVIPKNFTILNPRHSGKITAEDAISYESSNKSVATIDNNGNILAKRPGTTVITATTPYGKSSITVTVKYSFWQWLLVIFVFGWIWLPLK